MGEFISMRAARGRIEAKLLVDWGVSIDHPIALGNHPLVAHLLNHDAVSPVKGCKLCALLKAHQLVTETMEEDEDLQVMDAELGPGVPLDDLEDLQDLQDLQDRKEDAFQRWIRDNPDEQDADLDAEIAALGDSFRVTPALCDCADCVRRRVQMWKNHSRRKPDAD